MKICFLGDISSVHIIRWLTFFRDAGHEVSIITFKNKIISGVDVHVINKFVDINEKGGNIHYLKYIYKIRRIIKEINPDIVNAHYLTSYGFIASLLKDRPLIVSTWGSDILVTPNKNFIYRKLTEYVIKKCDLLTSDSNFMSEAIIKLKGKKEQLITVPMGVDIEVFNPNNRNDDDYTFLSMRTINANSNIDVILYSFKDIVSEFTEARLVIANTGDEEKKIIELIETLGLENNVEYMGKVNREEVVNLLKNNMIYISIPTSDSTSVTLLEAMATGIFPIVSNIPANKEWIENDENGLIINEINKTELVKAMKESIHNRKLIEKSKKKNYEIIKDKAIWHKNMELVESNYKKIINK